MNITKLIKIEGMSCGHCASSVEKSLKLIDEVIDVIIDLDKKYALVTLSEEIINNILHEAISSRGYNVISIENT